MRASARAPRAPHRLFALALLVAACRAGAPSESSAPRGDADAAAPAAAPSLESEVARLLAAPDLAAAVDELKLPPASFDAVVVPTYRRLFASYLAKFHDEAEALVPVLQRLAATAASSAASRAPTIKTRRHYAGDAASSLALSRLRWAQPVQAESWLVTIGDTPLDAAWVSHRGHWYLLLGLDEAALAALAARHPQCAAAAHAAGAAGPCSDAAWMAVDGALRDDADRVARACDRVLHLCAPPPPSASSTPPSPPSSPTAR